MLFDGTEIETDHPWFRNLAKPEFRPDIKEWCEATFARAPRLLDRDFAMRFRRETPQRISELLFAGAFLDAGWNPIGRVPGFDLAFELGNGRLLVEITTPEPHSSETWAETKGEGWKVWATDAKTEDAALRRLTGGFATKAEAVRKRCEAGEIVESDYVVIAISGIRLNQETPAAPGIGGPMPGFAKAFLPIGSQYWMVQIGDDTHTPHESGWAYKATIDQEGKAPVDRNFFLRPEFQHIHAVAYTPLHFGLGEPVSPIKECAALHNPMARSKDQAVILGLGYEYGVNVDENEFSVGFEMVKLSSSPASTHVFQRSYQ